MNYHPKNRFEDASILIMNGTNILAVIPDLESLPVISLSLADIACDVDIRKEVHLDLVDTVTGAGFTTAALGVK